MTNADTRQEDSPMSASQRVVLVIGASSGIGKATATLLAQSGFRVFGTSRHANSPAPENVTMLSLDVRDANSVNACVAAVLQQAERIDVLVNNSGIPGPIAAGEEVSIDQMRNLMEVNFFGALRMMNVVLPLMRRQKSGHIVNIGSAGGLFGAPALGAYSATKFALEGYTESLRYEVQKFNVQVSIIEPGAFKTNIVSSVEPPAIPLEDYATLRERVTAANTKAIATGADPIAVAQVILKIVNTAVPNLRYPVGTGIPVLVLARRLLPHRLFSAMVTKVFNVADWRP
jgi:NAD(P)-dependent dehydrogenase (short-subunit alcohol dehydrogenase family)